ncbi:hypothetical protein V6Z12_A11G251400 [Gossypium hirsutum]
MDNPPRNKRRKKGSFISTISESFHGHRFQIKAIRVSWSSIQLSDSTWKLLQSYFVCIYMF